MEDAQKLFADYTEELDQRELALVKQKKAVLAFVVTSHGSKDTQEHLTSLREAEATLNDVMGKLLEIKSVSDFREEAEKLCSRCTQLNAYTRDMDKVLSDDLTLQHRAEDKKSVDVLKNVTFLIAPPAAFLTAWKNGLATDVVNAYEAAGAGLVVSTTILNRKKIISAFKAVGAAVCSVPKKIANSFALYYMRETIKQRGKDATKLIQKGAHDVAALILPKRTQAIPAKVAEAQKKEL